MDANRRESNAFSPVAAPFYGVIRVHWRLFAVGLNSYEEGDGPAGKPMGKRPARALSHVMVDVEVAEVVQILISPIPPLKCSLAADRR